MTSYIGYAKPSSRARPNRRDDARRREELAAILRDPARAKNLEKECRGVRLETERQDGVVWVCVSRGGLKPYGELVLEKWVGISCEPTGAAREKSGRS